MTVGNGRNLNGRNLNGPLLNRTIVSVRYDGARREGMSTPLEETWLEGSVFHGLLDMEELSGIDFQQVRFIGNLDDGTTVPLRIEGVTPGTGAEQDVWSYRVTYQEPATGQWQPICVAADGTALDAIPLEGSWDYREGVAGGGAKDYDTTHFTFACEGAALAKCVRFGYAPWRSVNGQSLADHHQACTRLLRGDFCGDGTPHTVDGNLVNLYDAVSVQVDTESWSAEAEWTPEGASCFTSQNRSTTQIACADGRLVSTCAASFSPGTLIISEIPGALP
ncbi:MAG: hypothetical protein JXB05_23370 [Myxococcaceae bacterium]|nr:hypothetical protein [Myxococcaceae bacterium]